MATNNHIFKWFEVECNSIKSCRFHIFESLKISDQNYVNDEHRIALGGSYGEFLRQFGYAKLFTDEHDAPSMSIYPLKKFRSYFCENGKTYIGFGYRGQQSVFFDEEAVLSGENLKVFVVTKKMAREINSDFSDWLHAAYKWMKSKYSKKHWLRIQNGPPPFSSDELKIVEGRKKFDWKLVGFDEKGDALFWVRNNSKIILPYLSIGIRDKSSSILEGGAYLDVSSIFPNQEKVISKDCYKDKIPPDQLMAFDMPDPIPEKKAGYWEFGIP
jgi:hypothetical protein